MRKLVYLLTFFICTIPALVSAQDCESCNVTINNPSNENINLNGQTVCITGTGTISNVNGSGQLCVGQLSDITFNNSTYVQGWELNVFGNVTVLGNMTLQNSGSTVNVTSVGSLTVNGKIQANNSVTTFNLENGGILTANDVEFNESGGIIDGEMIVLSEFYLHSGNFEAGDNACITAGSYKTTNKNGSPEFASGACLIVEGDANLGGSTILNGQWTIGGNLSMVGGANITGTGGIIYVVDGTSTLQAGASINGTNMQFYDANTAMGYGPNNSENQDGPDYPNGFDSFGDQNNSSNFIIAAEEPSQNCCGEELGAVSGTVTEDTTGDGLGDTGIAGVTLNLVDETGAIVATVQTTDGTVDLDGDGNPEPAGSYYFPDVSAGNYTVEQEQPEGYGDVSEVDGGDDADNADNGIVNSIPVTVDAGETDTGNDFVEAQPMAIGSTVFEDYNMDGVQQAGEAGIPGVIVNAVTDPGTDGVYGTADDVIAGTSTTDGDGNYYIGGLAPGDYVVVIPQENFDAGGALATYPTSSPDGSLDEITDLDDNGQQPAGDATPVFSQTVKLTPGDQPTDDTAGGTESTVATIDPLGGVQDDGVTNPELDENGNMTIDFSFVAYRTLHIVKTVIENNYNGDEFEMSATGSESGTIAFDAGTESLADGESTSTETFIVGETITITELFDIATPQQVESWDILYTVSDDTGSPVVSGSSLNGDVTIDATANTASFDIDPAPSSDLTITITNVRQASIEIVKQTEPMGDPTEFEFQIGEETFILTGESTDDANKATFTFNGNEQGFYTLSETPLEGWEITSINCTNISGDAFLSADETTGEVSLEVENNDEVVCTYINRKVDLATMIEITSPTPAQGYYDQDDPITYTVTTTNQGAAPASDITIENYLPAELENTALTAGSLLINGNPAPASVTITYDEANNEFVIDFGDDPADWLGPNDVVSFDYTADITNGTPVGTEIINTIEISEFDTNNDGIPATDADSTPDAVNDDTVEDDEINEDGKADPANDEDDHDIAVLASEFVLPIVLQSFTADAVGADAELVWVTASEQNSSHFEIQVSDNGLSFETIAIIESQAVNGSSQVELSYSYADKFAAARGVGVYYKIKQVDFDGQFAFTPVRYVSFDDVQLTATAFPNPVQSGQAITVIADSIETVEVYTLNGDLVQVIEEDGTVRSTSIPTSNLSSGMYLVVINQKSTVKVIVQ